MLILRTKIFLAYLILFAVVTSAATLFTTSTVRQDLIQRLETRIRNEMNLIGNVLSRQPWSRESIDAVIERMGKDLNLRVTLIDDLGVVMADSEVPAEKIPQLDNHGNRVEVREAIQSGFGMSRRYSATLGQEMLYMAKRMRTPDGNWFIVRLSSPLEEVRDNVLSTLKILYLSSIAAFLLLILCNIWIAGRITKPVRTMTNMAQRIAHGDFELRIAPYTKDEIGDLARALDSMSQQLRQTFLQLNEEKGQLTSVFRAMVEGVMVVDKNGEIAFTNDAFHRFFSDTKDFKGMAPLAVLRNTSISDSIEKALEGAETFNLEIVLSGPPERHFIVNVVPLKTNGSLGGCIAVFHEVTKLKKLEAVRKDFVANVSHELRTPLTAIKGYAETLVDAPPDDREQEKEFLELILKHTNRLSSLTGDLLKLSAVDSGYMHMDRTMVDVCPFLKGMEQTFSNQIQEKSFRFSLDCAPETLQVYADRQALTQIFANLLDNALKYTPAGGSISVRAFEEPDAVHFEVSDSGIGMHKKDLERVFERFYRVDKERSRDLGGTGLGLAIVKNLVQVQHGAVWAESQPNKGSIFHVVLPNSSKTTERKEPELKN